MLHGRPAKSVPQPVTALAGVGDGFSGNEEAPFMGRHRRHQFTGLGVAHRANGGGALGTGQPHRIWPTMLRTEQTLFRRRLEVPSRKGGKIQMGFIPGFSEMKESVEEAIDLLRRAVAGLEKLAAEQERANNLYAEVNQDSLAHVQNVSKLSG